MMKKQHIAVLGAGIMGSSTALLLARRGASVALFDSADQPFSAASRWNEGKIHLGFLYNADPSMRTAGCILPGGLLFKPLVENLIGCSLVSATTAVDDIYLCHRDSVVLLDSMQDYFQKMANMINGHENASQYLVDVSNCIIERLNPTELRSISDSPDIIGGFRVPERSVATTWVADRFIDALSAEKSIEQHMGSVVTAARPKNAFEINGAWYVESSSGSHGPYDFVINSLWEGRLEVDVSAGLRPLGTWSNRFRRSLFIRTTEEVKIPSAIITTGPFGDVKNYNNRDFYLSWYPTGLMVESLAISPPRPSPLDELSEQQVCYSILETLGVLLPMTLKIRDRIAQMRLEGGWVFAAGKGALSDPESTLHRRTDFGITRTGSYISVDTGKYSTAPWLAQKVVDIIFP